MKIYLDVSCLNRPFDDQRQGRIRLEAEAVTLILQRFDDGLAGQVSSQMAEIEITANTDPIRRQRVRALLPARTAIMVLTPAIFRRAQALEAMGFKSADAVHVAAAEQAEADVFLTCDDRLMRTARRLASRLSVKVANPAAWLRENP